MEGSLPAEMERWPAPAPWLPVQNYRLFSAGGPLLLTQHGVLLPWSRGHLSAAATRVLAITDMEAQLGAIFDPREVGGVVRGREVPVSLQQWLAQRVAHIHRAGPGNQPGIVLALLYRLDAARVRELTLGGRARLAAGTGGREETWLREHPGTLANLEDFRLDLEAMARWCHPPSLFLTFSANVGTSDFLGAWVAHAAGVAREEVQVWAAEDERERLGAGGEEVGLYWVHQWCEEEQGTCHLHLPTAPAPPWRPGGTGLFPFH